MNDYRANLVAYAYQQAKTIHKLLLTLADDLGDLSALRDADPYFAESSDLVSGSLEPAMQTIRERLEKLTGR